MQHYLVNKGPNKVCFNCGGLELAGHLTKTECPGEFTSTFRKFQISSEGWDFKNGCWIVPALKGDRS